jgi:hypothetical protein
MENFCQEKYFSPCNSSVSGTVGPLSPPLRNLEMRLIRGRGIEECCYMDFLKASTPSLNTQMCRSKFPPVR